MTAASRPPLRLSIVIPARDEEYELPRTLASIAEAAATCAIADYEVIVVDDGSTDQTASLAEAAGTRVVSVKLHNIGAVRNAGAAVACGGVIIFLDADTRLPADVLAAAMTAIENGAVGGGARLTWDRRPSLFAAISAKAFLFCWQRLGRYAAGCFIFCRREAFEAVGGFDPQWLAAEERALSTALRQHGREHGLTWTILKPNVISSARKLRMFSAGQLSRLLIRTVFLPGGLLTGGKALQRSEGLEFFYDAPRETAADPE